MTSPHEDALEATIAYYRSIDDGSLALPGARQPIPLRLAGMWLRALHLG